MIQSSEKTMLRALAGETLTRPPFWLMRQAGRYLAEYREVRKSAKNFLNFCHSPDLAVEVTLQPLRRYHMDAAILFSDILVIPDALGQKVQFLEGEGPVLDPIRSVAELEQLDLERLHGHMAPVYETVGRLSREIPETTALIGFAGAPWTVATYMVEGRGSKDYPVTRSWAYGDPEGFAKLIDLLVEATGRYLIEQVKNGAEIIQIFDSWAGVLPPAEFRRWVIDPTIKLVETLKAACPGVPIIGFPRGAGMMYPDFVRETNVDGVSLDSTIPVTWAADNIQPHCTVQGNLDNMLLVAGGEAMERELNTILDVLGQGPFIFNLGHGIVPQTPPEHVARVAEIIQQRG
ncbi:uroporphyrinogen decarboxylase [Magnetospira sp. QH-2]|uniref:uroporphyrinogen decarboxylase n=1 Tax=Magnetospira sp. (strain QH-2) TaxID=1288970 RepID=UPI0003E81AC3|nr:uroporphyrinogen decarboxylase [Magnetospira sp. QH-2]CCQ75621.1 Uroporphyrinogen decarboxylase [Magnetospira sp. QH-2]